MAIAGVILLTEDQYMRRKHEILSYSKKNDYNVCMHEYESSF